MSIRNLCALNVRHAPGHVDDKYPTTLDRQGAAAMGGAGQEEEGLLFIQWPPTRWSRNQIHMHMRLFAVDLRENICPAA